MREKLLTFGNDFLIETDGGTPAFKVDGKALRVRDTIQFRDQQGRPLYRVTERLLRLKETMVIERDGRKIASIQKALVTPLRDRFTVRVEGGSPLHVQGNIFEHEYTITRDGARVATVSKRWFRVRDTYGVEVMPGEDDAFVLAVTAAVDSISSRG
ncbi:LURP-one-related/scramblase family protein [Haloarcula marina]|uniref:LURP-one-related/scramblase family protein n=1 Tax=Haloarcula marina TaxID=2961574 RepID=UPI0020B72031|nr:LURP-one-related family protein [Halomicroarcula marina]